MARMRVLMSKGAEDIDLETSEARSIVGSHWNAVQRFLSTGETDDLDEYKRIRIRGRRLMTDPDEIERLAQIGDLDNEGPYAEGL
jgi:hypothetical protein